MKSFRNWPPNYRFAYCLVTLGLLLCAVVLALRLGDGPGMVLATVGAATCAVLLVMMPRWALDHEQELQRRVQARAAREELRQLRRQGKKSAN